jgi:hypothetical protein
MRLHIRVLILCGLTFALGVLAAWLAVELCGKFWN